MYSLNIIILILVLSLFVIIVLRVFYELNNINLIKYKIKNLKNNSVLNFIFLSDLHQKFNHNYYNKLINLIKNINYDYIFIGGDLINYNEIINEDNIDSIIPNLINFFKIFSNKKIIYSFGNHELKLKNNKLVFDKFINAIKDYVIILDDNFITINNINIYGFSIFKNCYKKQLFNKTKSIDNNIIKEHLNKINVNDYNIVLSHNPIFSKDLINYGFDLVLSGHTHGGLIRLPFIGAIISSDLKLFPKYTKGLYNYKNKHIIVSNGIGEHTYKIRLNNIHEVYYVTISGE